MPRKLLGVDVMTGHWEFTYGAERVKEVVEKDFAGKIDFVAQNVKTADFGDPVFKPYVIARDQRRAGRDRRPGVSVHADRQPALLRRPSGRSASRKTSLQKVVDEARGKGAQVVVLLSHNGMDVDLKLASRVTRHRRDPRRPHARRRAAADRSSSNRGGTTLVTNAGSNGKFLGVLDLDVRGGKVADFRYRLLPVFSNLLPADPAMAALHRQGARAVSRRSSTSSSRSTEGLLYRRGNFNGTFDQLILDALMAEKDARDRVLAGLPLGHVAAARARRSRCEHLMDQTAITYPYVDASTS